MQVRVRGLGSLTRRATPRGGAAPPRRGAGDGDGLLADGRAPVPVLDLVVPWLASYVLAGLDLAS